MASGNRKMRRRQSDYRESNISTEAAAGGRKEQHAQRKPSERAHVFSSGCARSVALGVLQGKLFVWSSLGLSDLRKDR